MRIAIDAHSVGASLGGNETYATNLIEALAEIDSQNLYTLYVTKQSAVDRFSNRWPNFQVRLTLPHTPLVRIPLTLSRELRRNPVDLLHVQYTAPPFAPCPVISTIHDLAFEHLPETFKRRSWMQLRLTVRRTARKAAQLITLSDYSKQDLIRTYGIPAERITVTPAAAPKWFAPVTGANELAAVRRQYGIERDYVLSLSAIQPRKNLPRLIEAYDLLRQTRPESAFPQLVIAGKRGWLESKTLQAAETSRWRSDIVFTGYVPDEQLAALYSGALCFVYPSYFEGFGLPVLEAMQCGAPVIAGDRTSLPDIVKDSGLLVDPYDVQALASQIAELVDDGARRREFSRRALERAKQFTWKKTAELTLEVYEGVRRKTRMAARPDA